MAVTFSRCGTPYSCNVELVTAQHQKQCETQRSEESFNSANYQALHFTSSPFVQCNISAMLVSFTPSDTCGSISNRWKLTTSAEVLLTETEEKRVHTHGVHTEESMGNEVGANHHSLQRTATYKRHL